MEPSGAASSRQIVRFGFTKVYEPPQDIKAAARIIFVHGLNAHPYWTWTAQAPKSETAQGNPKARMRHFWPADFLPMVVPEAEVLIWGYDGDLRNSGSQTWRNSLSDYGGFLLECLTRLSHQEGILPILFVAHSLGGIIVEDALNRAGSSESFFHEIASITRGICFFGTPHRGYESQGTTFKFLAKLMSSTGSPQLKGFLDFGRSSEVLRDIHHVFIRMCDKYDYWIASFFETLPTANFGLIVAEASATLEIPRESTYPMDADHTSLIKFISIDDHRFHMVSSVLRRWVEQLKELEHTKPSEHKESEMTADLTPKILAWISSYDYQGCHQEAIRVLSAMDFWRQWLQESTQYQEWLASESSSALWLSGPAGTGKTAISTTMIEDALQNAPRNPSSPLMYFYCRRGSDNATSEPAQILSSILLQLVAPLQHTALPTCVLEFYEAHFTYRQGKRMSAREASHLLAELITTEQLVTIFIDAIDECSNPSELLKYLGVIIQSSSGSIKLCCTSRLTVDVSELFTYLPRSTPGKHIKISLADSPGHVRRFVETLVYGRKDRLLGGENPELEAKLVDILVENSGGNVRWIQLQLENLFQDNTLHHAEQFVGRLEQPQPTLHEDIMRRITEEALSSQRDLAIRTIKWLMCSFRPLTGDELVSAVTLVLDQPSELDITLDMVLDSCKHLIVQDEDGIVKFAHLSVEEYLQSFLLNGRQEFSLQESHAQASISCLLYLSVRSRKPEERPKKYSFHAYALMYWAAHCTECSEVRTDNARPLGHMLRRFLVEDLGPFEEWSRAFEAESKETTATFEMDVILDMWDDTLAFESSKDLIRPHPFLICCVFDLSEVLDILELGPKPKLSTDRTEAEVKARGVFLAVKYRRKDTLTLLLEIKDINTEGNDTASGKTALHESVQAERLDFVELLVMRGANINAEDMKGNTPLHYAALATDPGIALILLNSGANVNARNQEGIMPLNTAIKDGWQDVIEALIENGANPNARSQDHDGSGGTHEPLFNDELDNPALFDGDTVTIPMNTELLKAAEKKADDWFKELRNECHEIFDRRFQDDDRRVRVAIIDTGIERSHIAFKFTDMRPRIVEAKSFHDGGDPFKDLIGHGTHIADTLLRVAPQIELIIAQVDTGDKKARRQVADAIRWAVEKKADIVSMSVGFIRKDEGIRKAIVQANVDQGTLFFAAASNTGAAIKKYIAFPARMGEFVICINSTDGLDDISAFSPQTAERTDNFSIIGESIKAAWSNPPNSYQRKWGTSYATPIAAGIAALILGFAWQHPRMEIADDLKHPGVMRLVLRALSKPSASKPKYDILYPWEVLRSLAETTDVIGEIKAKVKAL